MLYPGERLDNGKRIDHVSGEIGNAFNPPIPGPGKILPVLVGGIATPLGFLEFQKPISNRRLVAFMAICQGMNSEIRTDMRKRKQPSKCSMFFIKGLLDATDLSVFKMSIRPLWIY